MIIEFKTLQVKPGHELFKWLPCVQRSTKSPIPWVKGVELDVCWLGLRLTVLTGMYEQFASHLRSDQCLEQLYGALWFTAQTWHRYRAIKYEMMADPQFQDAESALHRFVMQMPCSEAVLERQIKRALGVRRIQEITEMQLLPEPIAQLREYWYYMLQVKQEQQTEVQQSVERQRLAREHHEQVQEED